MPMEAETLSNTALHQLHRQLHIMVKILALVVCDKIPMEFSGPKILLSGSKWGKLMILKEGEIWAVVAFVMCWILASVYITLTPWFKIILTIGLFKQESFHTVFPNITLNDSNVA